VRSEDNPTLSTKVGEEFEIRLRSKMTSGFAWQALYDSQTFDFLGRETVNVSDRPGASADEVLRFRAKLPGRHTVTFALARPWEKGARDSLVYTVVVED
jgi:predicted secreted protein